MRLYSLILLGVLLSFQAAAQTCINKYMAVTLTGSTYDTFAQTVTTVDNNIISAGLLYDYNSAGHIARFTEKGTPLWSYTYVLDYYNLYTGVFFKRINFYDVLPVSDGGIIVAGNVEQVLSPFGLPPPVKDWGLISKLDKFGKVEWTKTLSNQGDLGVTNLYETKEGDIIAYMATDNGKKKSQYEQSYDRVIRMNSGGMVKWTSLLYTYLFDAGGFGVKAKHAVVQAKNGNIVIADAVHKTGGIPVKTLEGNLHFVELDYSSGKLNWETSYEYPVPTTDSAFLPDISQAIERPGGGFSFTTTLYLPTNPSAPLTKKAVIINTTPMGIIDNIWSYVPANGSECFVKQATLDKNNGNRTLLIDNAGQHSLLQLDADGQLVWQRGYQGAMPVNCFSSGRMGYNIFLSNNHTKQYQVLLTDQSGIISCVNQPAGFTRSPVGVNLAPGSVKTLIGYNVDSYDDYRYPLKRDESYPLGSQTECQQTLSCCTDFVDRAHIQDIHICAGTKYKLTDGTMVSDSGLYNVTYKTAGGCDSIRYYKISIDKDVKDLTLGKDTCLNGGTSFDISATAGYQKYFWMKSDVATGSKYKVSRPGVYEVMVENACGIRSDSIEIFELCDYPLYMPNAFTPNGDGVNDVFRVPALNKNNLVRLTVYNRWGQVYFQTKNPAQGWNGRFKQQEAEGGVYIYYLEMSGLSGHRLVEKGTIMLIR